MSVSNKNIQTNQNKTKHKNSQKLKQKKNNNHLRMELDDIKNDINVPLVTEGKLRLGCVSKYSWSEHQNTKQA